MRILHWTGQRLREAAAGVEAGHRQRVRREVLEGQREGVAAAADHQVVSQRGVRWEGGLGWRGEPEVGAVRRLVWRHQGQEAGEAGGWACRHRVTLAGEEAEGGEGGGPFWLRDRVGRGIRCKVDARGCGEGGGRWRV